MWESKLFKTGVGILLFFLIIYVGSHITFIFQPFIIAIEALFFSFLISGALYYITLPLVDRLQSRKVPRPIAITLVFMLLIGLAVLVVLIVGPVLQAELVKLVDGIPEKIEQAQRLLEALEESGLFAELQDLGTYNIDDITDQLAGMLTRTVTGIFTSIAVLFDFAAGIFMTIVIVPFLLYYMLKEKDSGAVSSLVSGLVPRDYAGNINKALAEMNRLLGSYVQGLGIVCFCVGVLAYIGFLIIGLEYSLILASFIMITNVVPFLGPFIGAIPAVIVGLLHSPLMMIKVIVIIVIVQQVESLLISPQVMGRKLALSPLAIILVVLIAGRLGGLLGIILAIPIFTVLKIVIAHIYAYIRAG